MSRTPSITDFLVFVVDECSVLFKRPSTEIDGFSIYFNCEAFAFCFGNGEFAINSFVFGDLLCDCELSIVHLIYFIYSVYIKMAREFLQKLGLKDLKAMLYLHNKQDNLTPYYKMNKTELIEAMLKFFTKGQLKSLAFKAGFEKMWGETYPEASTKPQGRPKGAKNVVSREMTKELREQIKQKTGRNVIPEMRK